MVLILDTRFLITHFLLLRRKIAILISKISDEKLMIPSIVITERVAGTKL